MRRQEAPSILLPPDYAEQQRRRRRERRRRVLRSPAVRSVFGLLVVLAVVARPAPVQGSFQALLAQTVEYVSILVDEWEKHSRILEDHLDRVTGVMQPFSDIHAGVRELMNTRGLMRTMRLVDTYRSSVVNPECYTSFPAPPGCVIQADFTPPEARELDYAARSGFHAAVNPMTLFELEEFAFDPTAPLQTVADALSLSGNPALAGRVQQVQDRIAANRTNARWHMRRARSVEQRTGHASRQFLYRGDLDPATGCLDTPVAVLDPVTGDEIDVTADATVLDQAVSADCLSSQANVDAPLEPEAHLSSDEAGTLQSASLIGIADLASLAVESGALSAARREEGSLRAEGRRRDRLTRLRNRIECARGVNGTIAYADGSGNCNVGGAVPDTVARLNAVRNVEAAVCFWPPSACF